MGKSLEHKIIQGLVFLMRGLGGLVGGPLEEGGFSDWSDWSDWSEILKGGSLRKKKKSRASGGRCGIVLFFSAGRRLRFRA